MSKQSPLYKAWNNMRQRCLNPNTRNYHRWGGRGITICEEWRTSWRPFEAWALAHGYAPGLMLDRVDNDGPYSPDNCRWVSRQQSDRNTSRNLLLTVQGETKTAIEWLEDPRCQPTEDGLYSRLRKGWSHEDAVLRPPRWRPFWTGRPLATHCPQGHAFTPENTYTTPKGARACRTCQRQASKRFRQRHQT